MNGAYRTCLDIAYECEFKKIQLRESDSKLMKQWNHIFKEVIKQKDKALCKETAKRLVSQNTSGLKLDHRFYLLHEL